MPKTMTLDGIHLYDAAYTPWKEAVKKYLGKEK